MRYNGFEDLLKRQAESLGDHVALIEEETAISYRQLYNKVASRRDELVEAGKTCMGIICETTIDCVVEIFACNLAGMQLVMLEKNLLQDTLQKMLPYGDVDILYPESDNLKDCLGQGVKGGKGRILFFTSGTTSSSKAVVLTDQSLMSSAYNGYEKLPLDKEDTLLCILPLSHVFGFVCGLLWGLSSGAHVALGRGQRHYMDDCAFYKPTAISVVPMLLSFLVKYHLLNDELKLILIGAGDCSDALLEAAASSGRRVCFGYGLTETSSGVAISTSGNPRAMEPCIDDDIRIEEDGEISIRCDTCMMQGYYKDPDATEDVLRDGRLYTGDLGRMDEEGKLYILGRKKDILVFSNGTKIFLPEYEEMIANVLGDDPFAVCKKNDKPVLVLEKLETEKQKIMDLLNDIPGIPRGHRIHDILVLGHELPKTTNGKVKRWEIEKEI